MPIYEYRCPRCRKKSSHFFRSFSLAEEASPRCAHCGAGDLVRTVSRVIVHRSSRGLDDMEDVDENDPKSMARWLRGAREEMGEDMGPEFDEALEQMEAGNLDALDEMDEDGFDDDDL